MSLVRTSSLTALAFIVSMLVPATAHAVCETFIRITQVPPNPTYQNTGNFRVEYGYVQTNPSCFNGIDEIDPATFRFTINGRRVDSLFTRFADYAIGTNIPLADDSTNVFLATIAGWNTNGVPRTDADQKSGYVDTTPLPNTQLTFYNYASQKLDVCAASCFAAVYAQSTVPYYSMNAPRNVKLVYHGDRVSPRPFVYVDVTQPVGSNLPSKFSLQVKVGGVFRTFLNGEQELFFTASSQTIRLAGQLDVSDKVTNVYDMQVIVNSYYALKTESQTLTTKLVVVNERTSPIARGWTVAGVQRLYVQTDSSLLITDGSGSAVYYQKCGTNCFLKPEGEFSSMSFDGGVYGYSRHYPDSTVVLFNPLGQMTSVGDRFGTYAWFDYDASGRLVHFGDPYRKYGGGVNRSYLTLEYGTDLTHGTSYGLKRVKEPDAAGTPGLGRTTSFDVSDSSLVTFTDPDGVSTRYQYDASKRLSAVINRRGDTLRYNYNAQSWKLDSIQSPSFALDTRLYGTQTAKLVTRFRPWQTAGVPTAATAPTAAPPLLPDSVSASVTDAGGHRTTFTVNKWGQPLRQTDPLGNVTTLTYSGYFVLLASVTLPTGASRTFGYAANGLPTQACSSGTPCVNFRYGAYGQVDSVWSTEAWGTVSERRFIGYTGRIDSVRYAGTDTLKTRYTYDTYGRVLSVKDPRNHIVYYHYDPTFGNLDSTLAPGNRASIVRFDQYGRDSASKAVGQPWSWVLYDAVNRPTVRNNGVQPSTVLSYDSLHLRSVTDAVSQVYRFEYNALGLLTKRHDAASYPNRYESFAYNGEGLLTTRTTRRGQALQFTYDTLHRPLSKSGTNTSVDSLGYSRDGRVSVGWNAVSRDSTFLAASGWLDSTVTHVAGQRFRQRFRKNSSAMLLDSVLVASTTSINFATRSFVRDPATLRLLSSRVGTMYTTVSPNADGRRDTTSWGGVNGVFAPNFKRTDSHTATHKTYRKQYSSAALGQAFSRGYGYDELERIRVDRETWPGYFADQRFGYDSAGRLIGVDSGGTFLEAADDSLSGYVGMYNPAFANITYAYDNVGNRTATGATYGTGNRISTFGGVTYATDLDGNVTGKGPTQYHWSADGLLDSVVTGSVTLRYRYNTRRQLVEKSRNGVVERIFLWQGASLLAELNGTATARIAEYAYDGLDQPSTLITGATTIALQRFFVQNELGNVTGVIKDSLTIAQQVNYDVWGSQTAVSGALGDTTRLRWKGLAWEGDSTKLYYVRNRWYDPETGRFMTEDPIGLAGGINLYAFAGNDPVNGFDPYGLCPTRYYKDGVPDPNRPGPNRRAGETGQDNEGTTYTCGCDGETWIGPNDPALTCGGDPSSPGGSEPLGSGGGGGGRGGKKAPGSSKGKALAALCVVTNIASRFVREGYTFYAGGGADLVVAEGAIAGGGVFIDSDGFGTYGKVGLAIGFDASRGFEFGGSKSFTGPNIEVQGGGNVALSATFDGGGPLLGLNGLALSGGWGSPYSGRIGVTNTYASYTCKR